MKNILSQFTFKKIGVLSATILAVSALTIFSLAPRSLNVAKSEDCQNAPTVATLNPFPYSYGSTAGYGCTDFAPVVARNLTQNGSYPQSADELLAGINAQAGDELYVRIYIHIQLIIKVLKRLQHLNPQPTENIIVMNIMPIMI